MKPLMFWRVGGLSPVKQRGNNSAPAKHGLYAFIWPYVEPFFLGSTNDNGIVTMRDRERKNTRYHQMKREGLRKFAHVGPVWSRLDMPGIRKGGWVLTDTEVLAKLLPQLKVERLINRYSKDHFEVFIERIISPK